MDERLGEDVLDLDLREAERRLGDLGARRVVRHEARLPLEGLRAVVDPDEDAVHDPVDVLDARHVEVDDGELLLELERDLRDRREEDAVLVRGPEVASHVAGDALVEVAEAEDRVLLRGPSCS